MSEQPPEVDIFSVWVKIEVDENGKVEGVDDDSQDVDEIGHEDGKEANDHGAVDKDGQQSPCQPVEESSEQTVKPKTQRKPPNSLKCDECDYRATYQSTLNIHKSMHAKTKKLSCDSCLFTTKYARSLEKHISALHHNNSADKFKCTECEYTTHSPWNLSSHKRKHTSGLIFKCTFCKFSTPHRYKLKMHSKSHSDETYQCEQCPFVTKFEGHIVRHRAKIHNQVSEQDLKCEKCNYVTKIRWRLNIHLKKSIQESEIKCEHCDFTSRFECEYKMHKVDHKGMFQSNEKSAICTSNDKFTSEYSEFSTPELEHNDANKFIVDTDCVNWKTTPVHKIEGTEKPFQCSKCNHTSKYKAAVQRHYERHHTDQIKPYKCINCDFSTKTKHQIALHNTRSKSELEIICKMCPYRTHFKCAFVIHQKIHYPYKCTQCDFTAKSTYDIQRHNTAVHLGKILTCDYCGFKSSRKETMSYHLTTHTGQKRYKCELCDYACNRPNLLTNHQKRFHRPVVLQENEKSLEAELNAVFGENVSMPYNPDFNWDGGSQSPLHTSTPMRTD